MGLNLDSNLVRAEINPLTGGIGIYANGQNVSNKIGNSLWPLYVETMVAHGRGGFGVPSGTTNYPTKLGDPGAYEVTGVLVTGGKGESTLTINTGTVADLAGTWNGTILHDDGIYRTYTIRSATGSTCICFPPLEACATRSQLTNTFDAASGQHLTESGAFALADVISYANAAYCYRNTFVGQIKETDTSGWTLYNGQNPGRVAYNFASNVHVDSAVATHLLNRRQVITSLFTNVAAGLTKTFTITGKTGYLESFVACADPAYPAIVDIYIDSNLAYRKYISDITRVLVPFGGADSLEIRITGAGAQTVQTKIGTTTAWIVPTDIQTNLFKDGERIGWGGDSWTSRCAGSVIRRLNANGARRGQTFVGIGSPGQQATWLVTNWAKVIAANLDALIIEYFINDLNSLTESGLATWLTRIQTLVSMCQSAGIRPIVLMPAATASQMQTQGLANWAAQLAEGTLAA